MSEKIQKSIREKLAQVQENFLIGSELAMSLPAQDSALETIPLGTRKCPCRCGENIDVSIRMPPDLYNKGNFLVILDRSDGISPDERGVKY